MYSFDSLTLKYFYSENKDFILNSIVQKIQLPSRHEIILNIRNISKSQNKKLYININPKYPHICFIDEDSTKKRNIQIPKSPPMFCMQLRKYLNGSKIKDFKLVQYERIVELYFDYFDEIGSLTRLCLALEFMGKHSNVILYNAQNKVIIGSIHNISQDKSSIREIYGGINYIYPPQKEKLDILKTSFSAFYEIAKNKDIKAICDNFYYFNQALVKKIFEKYQDFNEIFEFFQSLVYEKNKDFMCSFWAENKATIDEAINSYFSNIMFSELIEKEKNELKKYLLKDIKKLEKLMNSSFDNSKMTKYKQFADLLSMNLYKIPSGAKKEVVLDDIKIELDETLSLNENIQKFYKLYKKAKGAYEYNLSKQKEAKEKFDYFEGIIFDIEASESFMGLDEIKNELIEIGLIKNLTDSQKQKAPMVTKIDFSGYEIYLGKNNKQNDYLISKIASADDIWFHVYNCQSSHVILKVKKDKPPTKEVIEFCAKLTKDNSKAKNSGKTSIIYTRRKNLKKPPNTYLGYVTYKNEKEIVI